MSKLAEAIRRSQRVEAAPMGFGAARVAPKPTMLVGFAGRASDLAKARDAGADLLLVDEAGKAPSALDKLREAGGSLPLGVRVDALESQQAKDLKAAGIDFTLVDAQRTSAAALLDEELGAVLILPEQAEELFLRSLEPLQSLEAVYVASVPSPLTLLDQIDLARKGGLSRKPLLCRVEGESSSEELQCLRAAGAVVVITGSADAVAGLKQAVAALPARKQRREERPVVSLPRNQAPQPDHDDDDDDE
jgi:hypothetical protein